MYIFLRNDVSDLQWPFLPFSIFTLNTNLRTYPHVSCYPLTFLENYMNTCEVHQCFPITCLVSDGFGSLSNSLETFQ